jgi:protein-S-isoprenylcysteine O-methyltransferase Ste14
MKTPRAAAGSALFFVLAPGVVAVVIPLMLTRWDGHDASWGPLRTAVGAVLVGGGLLVLVPSFVRFVREGRGTPAPIAPTEQLVVGGVYRFVRNPMYLAVLAVIVGQALILWDVDLAVYAVVVAAAMVAFTRLYEEPTLASRYGNQYEEYLAEVPGWLPRVRPWRPPGPGAGAPPDDTA